jgi:hypothetical protein
VDAFADHRFGPLADQAARKAEALLLEHLSPEQLRSYREKGSISVVRRGVLWPMVGKYAAVLLLPALGFWLPGSAAGAAVALLMLLIFLLVFLSIGAPSLRIACSRRRTWEIGARESPKLELGGQEVRFCVRFDMDMPSADRMLAYKNILESDEPYFLRRANVRL